MRVFPIFLSVVCTLRNCSGMQQHLISEISAVVSKLVSDYELIIVDNASTDDSVLMLKNMTDEHGMPNLQVYALTREVDSDTASWAGLENALGDFVVVLNPIEDDVHFLQQMLSQSTSGIDVVFARNDQRHAQKFVYRAAFASFNILYKWCGGVNLNEDAPQYRILSRRVINFILQHPRPAISYRHLPASGGFPKINLRYSAAPKLLRPKRLRESIERGMRLLVSTTRVPMRLVTTLSLFGACANICYVAYVIAVGLLKEDVAPGWISLSLQQSGMFFLISLVLLVLGEYILNMVSLSNEGPSYHVGQEFTSARMTKRDKLNVEDN